MNISGSRNPESLQSRDSGLTQSRDPGIPIPGLSALGSSARQSQTLKIVQHFDFDLTCDVICDVISDPEVNKIRFPSTNSPDLSNAV